MSGEEITSFRSSLTNEEIASKIDILNDAFSSRGLTIHPQSGMGFSISNAEEALKNTDPTYQEIFSILQFERAARAVVAVLDQKNVQLSLRRLLDGSLDFFDRKPSVAKNTLFELEIYRSLSIRNAVSSLDEPDVLLHINKQTVGFACKKTYSEANLSKTLSKAVSQIEKSHCEYGVVAFNIDDLLPGGRVLQSTSYDAAGEIVAGVCNEFLRSHSASFQKYFRGSRIIGALAFCSVMLDLNDTAFNNFQQWYLWVSPEMNDENLAMARNVNQLIQRESV